MRHPQQTIPIPALLDALREPRSGLFEKALKHELENLPEGTLPLEKGTSQGGFVDDSNISVTVIYTRQYDNCIQAKIGVFFTEIIVGCGCGDEPMPENAYCELLVSIDRKTSAAGFEVSAVS